MESERAIIHSLTKISHPITSDAQIRWAKVRGGSSPTSLFHSSSIPRPTVRRLFGIFFMFSFDRAIWGMIATAKTKERKERDGRTKAAISEPFDIRWKRLEWTAGIWWGEKGRQGLEASLLSLHQTPRQEYIGRFGRLFWLNIVRCGLYEGFFGGGGDEWWGFILLGWILILF